METLQDHNSLVYAQGIDIQGLLWLDTFRPKKALECFNVCWKIRANLLEASDPFIAVALNHISLAYTELRDFDKAAAYQQKAIDIRLEIKSTMIGNSYSNMSSILLGMDKPEEAEAMLMNCPSLKDMSDESFLRTDNPRFSRYARPVAEPQTLSLSNQLLVIWFSWAEFESASSDLRMLSA